MKILIINSHKGVNPSNTNLHFLNSKILAERLGADLIWSYPTVNDNIKTGYDVIIYVHASAYSFVDELWLEKNPDAELYYVTNEYNLGEPSPLWRAAKAGRHYSVIANHSPEASKVVTKYTKNWSMTNLNSLILKDELQTEKAILRNSLMNFAKNSDDSSGSVLYWGSYRKGREKYYKKYLGSPYLVTSTHEKNRDKFFKLGIKPQFTGRIDVLNGRVPQKYSLYIEDEHTHKHFNNLANRFYESLNLGMIPLFDESCIGTIEKSGYPIDESCILTDDIPTTILNVGENRKAFHKILTDEAKREKEETLQTIEKIIKGEDNVSTSEHRRNAANA